MLQFLTMFGIGIVIGLQHALEADHVIAVTTLTSQTQSTKKAVRLAALWGLGHTATLFLVGLLVLLLKFSIPPSVAAFFEFVVGLLLIALGANVLWQIFTGRMHLHEHEHDGVKHTHFHSHAHETTHAHDHRSFLVGVVHGLAGSAALVLLVPAVSTSILPGLLFILCFGIGSIVAMVLITILITAPVRLTARYGRINQAITVIAGAASVVAGVIIVTSTF